VTFPRTIHLSFSIDSMVSISLEFPTRLLADAEVSETGEAKESGDIMDVWKDYGACFISRVVAPGETDLVC
jgi:hypothetical protein